MANARKSASRIPIAVIPTNVFIVMMTGTVRISVPWGRIVWRVSALALVQRIVWVAKNVRTTFVWRTVSRARAAAAVSVLMMIIVVGIHIVLMCAVITFVVPRTKAV